MFANRVDAGEQLANILKGLSLPEESIVVGIPRGGVVVAAVIARRLQLPLGHVLVKKIGAPYNAELAIGAVGEGNTVYWDQEAIERVQISPETKRLLKEKGQRALADREKVFSEWYTRPVMSGRTALLVDDGIATGATAICAAAVAKHHGVEHVFLVTPLIPQSVVASIRQHVTEIISFQTPDTFVSVGQFYISFPEVSDDEVKVLLQSRDHYHSNRMET